MNPYAHFVMHIFLHMQCMQINKIHMCTFMRIQSYHNWMSISFGFRDHNFKMNKAAEYLYFKTWFVSIFLWIFLGLIESGIKCHRKSQLYDDKVGRTETQMHKECAKVVSTTSISQSSLYFNHVCLEYGKNHATGCCFKLTHVSFNERHKLLKSLGLCYRHMDSHRRLVKSDCTCSGHSLEITLLRYFLSITWNHHALL